MNSALHFPLSTTHKESSKGFNFNQAFESNINKSLLNKKLQVSDSNKSSRKKINSARHESSNLTKKVASGIP